MGQALIRLPISTWLVADVAITTGAVWLGYRVFPPFTAPLTPHIALWQAAAIFPFAVVISSLIFGLYERETLTGRSRILTRMLLTAAAATVIAYAIIYVVMYATVSRRTAALAMALYLVGCGGIRIFALWAIKTSHRGLLVVGSRSLFDFFQNAKDNGFLHEYRLVGYAAPLATSDSRPDDSDYLGGIDKGLPDLEANGVTDVVVGAACSHDSKVMEWVVPCLQHGCRVTNEAVFYEKATGQILVDEITPSWFLFADLKVHCDEHATMKRLVDLVTAGVGLLLTLPTWPLIAIAVKLCDGGPVFYAQDRVGKNGRVFTLYKFRTMRTDAENGKSVWCAPNDPRVTPVGRLLRKSRLDELPQLYNVLIGQMSIVGPRPERPDIVEELAARIPYYRERHLVKPGITGWAQIGFRYGSSIEDAKRKLQFDLYYLKEMSFEMDMIILFRTVGTFLRGGI
jgi:sugar transferase (PEP-CTERM system associated)